MNVIDINGRKFARNDGAFMDSLFSTGGTCDGFFRRTKHGLILLDMQRQPIAALLKNKHGNHFVTCHEHNGRMRYMYALASIHERFFDMPESYREEREIIDRLAAALL